MSAEPNTSNTSNAAVAAIAQDVECPSCGYNLRGLRGSIVTCPECGTRSDAAKLVSQRWTKPWHRAPGFNTLLVPCAWFAASYLLLVLIDVAGFARIHQPLFNVSRGWTATVSAPLITAALFLLFLLVWLWLMWRAWRLFQSMRGVWLALLAHGVFVGYLFVVLTGLGFLLNGVLMLGDEPVSAAILLLVSATLLIGGVWLCRRGERYIASQCIRRYLDQQVVEKKE